MTTTTSEPVRNNEQVDEAEQPAVKSLTEQQVLLKEQRLKQRLRYFWLLSSLGIATALGAATVYGIWATNRTFLSYAGLLLWICSTAVAGWLVFKHRPVIAQRAHELAELENKHRMAAARFERNVKQSLRVYRAASYLDIESYRRQARQNRMIHNFFQAIIIVGSIGVTSLTSAGLDTPLFRWSSVILAGMVSISAGFTGYFKFRERGFNQQLTADAIEKEYNAVDLRVGDYDATEEEALKRYAVKVEALKEEQRKRELQLEQSSTELNRQN